MPPYSRLESDVNLTEEEELRRLESGAAESAPDLLCTARAILQEANGGVGTLNVFSERFEWDPDDQAAAFVCHNLSDVHSHQSNKAEAPTAKLKITFKPLPGAQAKSITLNFTTSPGDLSASKAQRDLIRDTLEGRLKALGLKTGGPAPMAPPPAPKPLPPPPPPAAAAAAAAGGQTAARRHLRRSSFRQQQRRPGDTAAGTARGGGGAARVRP